MAIKDTDFLGGLAKGLKVIEAFGASRERLSITEASRLAGLDRATARRCLLTLAELGYATYDGKFFTLAPPILRLGHAYLSATPLPAIVQPFLDRLSEEVGQSCSASVLDGTEIAYVARAAHRRVMSVSLTAGSRLPAWCSSMGRVWLASRPDSEIRAILARSDIVAHTRFTITDPEALLEVIRKAAREGHAVIDQELEIGLSSMAVPVLDSRGRMAAAINIGAPAAQVDAASMPGRYLELLRKTAAGITPLLP